MTSTVIRASVILEQVFSRPCKCPAFSFPGSSYLPALQLHNIHCPDSCRQFCWRVPLTSALCLTRLIPTHWTGRFALFYHSLDKDSGQNPRKETAEYPPDLLSQITLQRATPRAGNCEKRQWSKHTGHHLQLLYRCCSTRSMPPPPVPYKPSRRLVQNSSTKMAPNTTSKVRVSPFDPR